MHSIYYYWRINIHVLIQCCWCVVGAKHHRQPPAAVFALGPESPGQRMLTCTPLRTCTARSAPAHYCIRWGMMFQITDGCGCTTLWVADFQIDRRRHTRRSTGTNTTINCHNQRIQTPMDRPPTSWIDRHVHHDRQTPQSTETATMIDGYRRNNWIITLITSVFGIVKTFMDIIIVI